MRPYAADDAGEQHGAPPPSLHSASSKGLCVEHPRTEMSTEDSICRNPRLRRNLVI